MAKYGFTFLVLVLCGLFMVVGCAQVSRALMDYQIARGDVDSSTEMSTVGALASNFADGLVGVLVPNGDGYVRYAGGMFGLLVSGILGVLLGRRKRKRG